MRLIVLTTLLLNLGTALCQTPDEEGYVSDEIKPSPTNAHVEPMKKANCIIVSFNGSREDAYIKLGQTILGKGYSIESANKDFFTISTSYKSVNSGKVKIHAVIMDSTILFRGHADFGEINLYGYSSKNEWEILYTGGKNSIAMAAWNELDMVAKSFPANFVTYAIK